MGATMGALVVRSRFLQWLSLWTVLAVLVAGAIAAAASALALEAEADVTGTVTSAATGEPVADVAVIVSGPSFGSTVTAADGTYSFAGQGLAAGEYTVQFAPPSGSGLSGEYWDSQSSFSDATPVDLVAGSTVANIDAALEAEADVTGTVTSAATGEPVADVAVFVSGPSSFGSTVTGADGTYSFAGQGLAAGEYRVRFSPPFGSGLFAEYWNDRRSAVDADPVELSAGETIENLDAALDASATVGGTVTYEGTGVQARVVILDAESMGVIVTSITAAGDGSYEVAVPSGVPLSVLFEPSDETLARQYWQDADGPESAEQLVLGAGGLRTGIDASLRAAATISGTVQAAAGPLEDPVFVTPYRWDGESWQPVGQVHPGYPDRWGAAIPAGSDGAYRLTGLPPGTYTIGFDKSSTSFSRYCPQYWEDRSSLASADPVTAEESGPTNGIDASLLEGDCEAVLPDLSPGTPTISGEPRVGETLTADPGSWGPEPVELAYQWNADGEPVPGATGVTFVPGPDQLGAVMTVTVTGTKSGYNPASRTSEPVGPVISMGAALPPTGHEGDRRPATGHQDSDWSAVHRVSQHEGAPTSSTHAGYQSPVSELARTGADVRSLALLSLVVVSLGGWMSVRGRKLADN